MFVFFQTHGAPAPHQFATQIHSQILIMYGSHNLTDIGLFRPITILSLSVPFRRSIQHAKTSVCAANDYAGSEETTSVLKDALSGVVVALASVPTSIAFANIAGVNPLVGIWSSVIVGLVMSLAGKSPGLIAGAAGVVAVPLAPLVAKHGVAYMAPSVMLAAVLVVLTVATKLSRAVSLVTDNVMKVIRKISDHTTTFYRQRRWLCRFKISSACLIFMRN